MMFFLDSNAFFENAESLRSLAQACSQRGIPVVTSALVLAERLHQAERRGQDVAFADAKIRGVVGERGVVAFDEHEAALAASAIAVAVMTRAGEGGAEQSYQEIKRDRLIEGLGQSNVLVKQLGKNRKYPATVDIYLAGQVLARCKEGAVMVTRDIGEGSEFAALGVPTCTLDDAIQRASEAPSLCP
jgi:predicted nucleic acid-binding protein